MSGTKTCAVFAVLILMLTGCTSAPNQNDARRQYLKESIEINDVMIQTEQGSVTVFNNFITGQLDADHAIRLLDGYLGTALQTEKIVKNRTTLNEYKDLSNAQKQASRNLTAAISLMKTSIITNDPADQQNAQTHISWTENNIKRCIRLITIAVNNLS